MIARRATRIAVRWLDDGSEGSVVLHVIRRHPMHERELDALLEGLGAERVSA